MGKWSAETILSIWLEYPISEWQEMVHRNVENGWQKLHLQCGLSTQFPNSKEWWAEIIV